MANADVSDFTSSTVAGNAGVVSGSNGVISRMILSVRDMDTQLSRLIGEAPSEARLFSIVMLSNLVFMLSWSINSLMSPTLNIASFMGFDTALWLLVAMSLRTTLIYGLAAVVAVSMRAVGGKGSIQDTRTGVFWGMLVAAPFSLVLSLAIVIANQSGGMSIPAWFVLLPSMWFVAKGAASANRINVFPVALALTAAAVVGAFGLRMLLL